MNSPPPSRAPPEEADPDDVEELDDEDDLPDEPTDPNLTVHPSILVREAVRAKPETIDALFDKLRQPDEDAAEEEFYSRVTLPAQPPKPKG
jgi:hypothetical protein